ncbi:hypothetical protein HNO88_003052 [Novosphingobium chloroacetimidivorans]|uniref:Uncharacterized protein n=1 Tax=Novosphingobium chloroacetimidivorans TaxID=1428314 RepID=A0A7W7KCK4_9SPHN|nr:hypothetical protein [Novosphingobium chloroacetimidivorans]MBB4859723.1 hypothetical protein [Novosphingobium chloroacetimidivorans]
MSDTEHTQINQTGPSIGAEIPYRRDRIDKKTGSLVFDRHLDEVTTSVPEQAPTDDMPKDDNPLRRGQVT